MKACILAAQLQPRGQDWTQSIASEQQKIYICYGKRSTTSAMTQLICSYLYLNHITDSHIHLLLPLEETQRNELVTKALATLPEKLNCPICMGHRQSR